MIPLDIVEQYSFRALLNGLQCKVSTKFQIMHRKQLTKFIEEKMERYTSTLKENFKNIRWFCATADCWKQHKR